MDFILGILAIIVFYAVLTAIDTVIFHNKPGDFRVAFKSKIFVTLTALSVVLGVIYFIFRGQDLLSTVLFLMYTTFLAKLVVKRM